LTCTLIVAAEAVITVGAVITAKAMSMAAAAIRLNWIIPPPILSADAL